MMFSTGFNRYQPISTVFNQFQPISTVFNYFHPFLPVFTRFHPFSNVFTRLNQFSPAFRVQTFQLLNPFFLTLSVKPTKNQHDESMLFAFIPGGYWQDMNPAAYPCVGEMPGYGSNCTFGLITYQISPKQTVENQILAVAEGLLKLAEQHPKSRALAIAGHSAGAHLMLMAVAHLAKTNTLPKIPIRHLYSISGIYSGFKNL